MFIKLKKITLHQFLTGILTSQLVKRICKLRMEGTENHLKWDVKCLVLERLNFGPATH